jgi:hypothetical protein
MLGSPLGEADKAGAAEYEADTENPNFLKNVENTHSLSYGSIYSSI